MCRRVCQRGRFFLTHSESVSKRTVPFDTLIDTLSEEGANAGIGSDYADRHGSIGGTGGDPVAALTEHGCTNGGAGNCRRSAEEQY